MGNRDPGEGIVDHGPVGRGFSSSVRGNSTAFGFSIMITASFGVLDSLQPTKSLGDVLFFGIAAALSVGLLEGIVTRGFRLRVTKVPSEVALLGTALNFASVAAGVGTAIAVGEAIDAPVAWPVAGFAAPLVYIVAEAAEIMVAERLQQLRGDPHAGEEEPD